MKKVIFGAGRNGRRLLKLIDKKEVYCFVDNDSQKWGEKYEGIPIISFDEMKKQVSDVLVILSVNSDEMRLQLKEEWGIYLEYRDYLNSQEYTNYLDKKLFWRYKTISPVIYEKKNLINWYRKNFHSELNKWIVEMFRNGQDNKVLEFLNNEYNEEFYSDEKFENRPGMRLVANIVLDLEKNVGERLKVCDMACGHGELLNVLNLNGILCYGTDISLKRVLAVRDKGISCECANVENTNYKDEFFDVVICQECLEHVKNVLDVVAEIKRILKKRGMVIVTVPIEENSDSVDHVRQFSKEDLYHLFANQEFKEIKIMKIPYLNESMDDNFFLTAHKY